MLPFPHLLACCNKFVSVNMVCFGNNTKLKQSWRWKLKQSWSCIICRIQICLVMYVCMHRYVCKKSDTNIYLKIQWFNIPFYSIQEKKTTNYKPLKITFRGKIIWGNHPHGFNKGSHYLIDIWWIQLAHMTNGVLGTKVVATLRQMAWSQLLHLLRNDLSVPLTSL